MKWEINNEIRPYYCPNSLNCDYGSCKVLKLKNYVKIRGDFTILKSLIVNLMKIVIQIISV